VKLMAKSWIETHSVSLVDLVLASALVGLDVVTRLSPPAPNFVPIAATALFAGAVLQCRVLSLAVPLIALILSDSILGYGDWQVMAVVYAALVLPVMIGRWGQRFRSPVVFLPLALSSSLIFFVTTNFAVWMFSGMYAHDVGGLSQCYAMALPFFKNTIVGDLFWTSVLFSGYRTGLFVIAWINENRSGSLAQLLR
jgi:hypothetical protein